MGKTKPLTYPNLVETMLNVGNAHADVHATVAQHAVTHAAKKAAHHQHLEITQHAHALMTGGEEK